MKQRVLLIKNKWKLYWVKVACLSWSRQDFEQIRTNSDRSHNGIDNELRRLYWKCLLNPIIVFHKSLLQVISNQNINIWTFFQILYCLVNDRNWSALFCDFYQNFLDLVCNITRSFVNWFGEHFSRGAQEAHLYKCHQRV